LRFGTEVGGPSHGNYTEELKRNKVFVTNDIKVGQKDVLFIIDMQYDFVDQPFTEFNDGKERIQYLEGGAFSAPESSDIVSGIAGLVPKFKQSLIIATKDYHPKGHCSFKGYPPHCVVGSKGAKIVKPIWKAIRSLANAYVAFKGFHPEYDSYSALTYNYNTSTPTVRCQASDDTSWTGSFVVKTTDNQRSIWREAPNLFFNQYRKLRFGDYDRSDTFSKQYNPPEDEFKELVNDCTDSEGEYLDKKSSCKLKHVEELLTRIDKNNKIFICGLVGDICVLDTAINLKNSGYMNVYIIFDLTRMVYIPGSGYLMSPKKYAEILKVNGIQLIESKNITLRVI
jgi:nicotinamidase-related amidase